MEFGYFVENKNLQKIIKSLRHPEHYARKISDVEKETQLEKEEILQAIKGHKINHFVYKDTEYLGVPERQKVYQKDKEKGINPYESNYKGDAYRSDILKGKSRFKKIKRP